MSQQERYLHDFVYMRLGDGPVVKVAVADISKRMWQGYTQVENEELWPKEGK